MSYVKENKNLSEMCLKRCSKCKIIKSFAFFANCKQSKSGHYSVCKECKQNLNDEWSKINREKIEINQARRNKNRKNNPEKAMYDRAKRRSSRMGVSFDIDYTDIHIPKYCPAIGIELHLSSGRKYSANSPSLDKIVPILGYVKGNIQVISRKANTMKSNATIQELELFSKWITQSMNEWKKIKNEN